MTMIPTHQISAVQLLLPTAPSYSTNRINAGSHRLVFTYCDPEIKELCLISHRFFHLQTKRVIILSRSLRYQITYIHLLCITNNLYNLVPG